jgi:hypothetical protein
MGWSSLRQQTEGAKRIPLRSIGFLFKLLQVLLGIPWFKTS